MHGDESHMRIGRRAWQDLHRDANRLSVMAVSANQEATVSSARSARSSSVDA